MEMSAIAAVRVLEGARARLRDAGAVRVVAHAQAVTLRFEVTADGFAHGELTASGRRAWGLATPDAVLVRADSIEWFGPRFTEVGRRLVGRWIRPDRTWMWGPPGEAEPWRHPGQWQQYPYVLDVLRPEALARMVDRLIAGARTSSGRDEYGRPRRRTVWTDPERGVVRAAVGEVSGEFACEPPGDPLRLAIARGSAGVSVRIESTAVDAHDVRATVSEVLRPAVRAGAAEVRAVPDARGVPSVMAAGEDMWFPPAEWRRSPLPRRGDGSVLAPVPPTATDPRVIGVPEPPIGDVFPTELHWNLTVHPPETVVQPPAASPLGLAMFHALVTPDPWFGDAVEPTVDAWVVRYGLPAACEAAARLLGLRPQGRVDVGGVTISQQATEMCDDHPGIADWMCVLNRVREHLAVADQADYQLAVDGLAALRSRSTRLWAHVAAAYLVPERQDWMDAVLRAGPAHGSGVSPYALLGNSIEAREQLDRLVDVCGTAAVDACLPDLVSRLGPDAA
ncbi:MAG: hypothetical protein HOQ24_18015, partial [Mycobacteriaceae bacterium]|nr:hypothetical protein [Mycobacteriaceae bacterium]